MKFYDFQKHVEKSKIVNKFSFSLLLLSTGGDAGGAFCGSGGGSASAPGDPRAAPRAYGGMLSERRMRFLPHLLHAHNGQPEVAMPRLHVAGQPPSGNGVARAFRYHMGTADYGRGSPI